MGRGLAIGVAALVLAACYRDVPLGAGDASRGDASRGDAPPPLDARPLDVNAVAPCLDDDFGSGSAPDPQLWTATTTSGADVLAIASGALELDLGPGGSPRVLEVTSLVAYAQLDVEVHVEAFPSDGPDTFLELRDAAGSNSLRFYATAGAMNVDVKAGGTSGTIATQITPLPYWRLRRDPGDTSAHIETSSDDVQWNGTLEFHVPSPAFVVLGLSGETMGAGVDVARFDFVHATCE